MRLIGSAQSFHCACSLHELYFSLPLSSSISIVLPRSHNNVESSMMIWLKREKRLQKLDENWRAWIEPSSQCYKDEYFWNAEKGKLPPDLFRKSLVLCRQAENIFPCHLKQKLHRAVEMSFTLFLWIEVIATLTHGRIYTWRWLFCNKNRSRRHRKLRWRRKCCCYFRWVMYSTNSEEGIEVPLKGGR